MSAKSKKLSVSKKDLDVALDRPFDPQIWEEAQRFAHAYRLILEPDEELGFLGRSVEIPFVMADGKTADKCVRETQEALTVAVATMLEEGQQPPMPVSRGTRQTQVNIRLSTEEKLIVEESARRQGFRGVSDFVRAAALAQAVGQQASKKNGR